MRVVTYLRDVAGLEDPDLVALWKDSWSRAGWRPVILGPTDAEKSPLFGRVHEHREFFTSHTVNPPDYQLACIERWCAASMRVPGDFPVFMADWDVINYGFSPAEALRDYGSCRPTPVLYTPGPGLGVCPAAAVMSPRQFGVFAAWFVEQAALGHKWKACHDEDLLMNGQAWPLPARRIDEAPRLGHEIEARKARGCRPRLVHYSNGSTTERPRSVVVRRGHPFDW